MLCLRASIDFSLAFVPKDFICLANLLDFCCDSAVVSSQLNFSVMTVSCTGLWLLSDNWILVLVLRLLTACLDVVDARQGCYLQRV